MNASQRGNVYMDFALLALGLVLAAALLAPLHKAFALLLPLGILVFFLPNLIALADRVRNALAFRRELAAARAQTSPACLLLRNELHGSDAQALLLDPSPGTLCLVACDTPARQQALATLQRVRTEIRAATTATSFHEGTVRIPQRYVLVFEFADGEAWQLLTLRKRRLAQWTDALQPHLGDRLARDPVT